MDWLNFHHLRYFYVVAREGSIARASELLHTSSPSISVQLKQLEQQLGERLFIKQGRQLVLTEVGNQVREYAEQIFSLGSELIATVRGQPGGRAARVRIGIADSVAKELAARLLAPIFDSGKPVRSIVREGPAERLLADLALHQLDLVLLDEPPPAISRLKVFQHPLGEAAIGVFASVQTAAKLRRRFPQSLADQPFVLPLEDSLLRRAFDDFCREANLQVAPVAEVEDSGLAKTLAREGRGLLLAPTVLRQTLRDHYGLRRIGELPNVRVPYIACTVARQVHDPLIAWVLQRARDLLGE
jgi:LysR family transcriptional regulator, transcriptional activator of nhaA